MPTPRSITIPSLAAAVAAEAAAEKLPTAGCRRSSFSDWERHLTPATWQAKSQQQQQQQPDLPPNEKDESISDALSSLSLNDLQPMPVYPELRRNVLLTELSLTTVSSRIASWMRMQSVHSCKLMKSESLIDCWTTLCNSQRVHFVINLWNANHTENGNGTETNTKADHPRLAVQLDRRSGCAVVTQILRRCLYHMIQSEQDPIPGSSDPRSCSPPVWRVCSRIKRLLAEEEEHKLKQQQQEQQNCKKLRRHSSPSVGTDSMRRCQELLRSDCRDERRLGMESLVSLTDSTQTTREIAERVATVLVVGRGTSVCSVRTIRSYLRAYLNQKHRATHLEPQFYRDDDDLVVSEFASDHHHAVMHSLALKTLCSSLQVLSLKSPDLIAGSDLCRSQFDFDAGFWFTVLHALAVDVKDAAHRPDDAALAARSLCLLVTLFPDAADVVVEESLLPHLLLAQKVGQEQHCELEQQISNLLRTLENAHV